MAQSSRTPPSRRASTSGAGTSPSSTGRTASTAPRTCSAGRLRSRSTAPAQERYQDEGTADGVLYRYQDETHDNHFNTWLRSARRSTCRSSTSSVRGRTGTGPMYPAFVERRRPAERSRARLLREDARARLTNGSRCTSATTIERRYVVREVKQRIHQAQFRGAVLPAYRDRCAICRLKEMRLLDAAHIVADAEEAGEPVISNGLSLCSIHHRAFDEDLVGVSPDSACTSRAGCSTTRTARCWTCSRGFTGLRSTRRPGSCGGQTENAWRSGSSGSAVLRNGREE